MSISFSSLASVSFCLFRTNQHFFRDFRHSLCSFLRFTNASLSLSFTSKSICRMINGWIKTSSAKWPITMSTTSTRNNEHDSKDTKKMQEQNKRQYLRRLAVAHTQFYFTCTNFVCNAQCTQCSSAHSVQFDFPTPKNRHKRFSFRFCLRRTTTATRLNAANSKCSRSTDTVQTGDDFSCGRWIFTATIQLHNVAVDANY